MKDCRIVPAARRDLERIHQWISVDDPAAADRVLRALRTAVARIRAFPGSGHARPDLGAAGVRFVAVRPYLVVYVELPDRIDVLRVLHASRNVAALLAGKDPSDE